MEEAAEKHWDFLAPLKSATIILLQNPGQLNVPSWLWHIITYLYILTKNVHFQNTLYPFYGEEILLEFRASEYPFCQPWNSSKLK